MVVFATLDTNNTTTMLVIVPDDPALTIGSCYIHAMHGSGYSTSTTATTTTTSPTHCALDVGHGFLSHRACGFDRMGSHDDTTVPPYMVLQARRRIERALVTHSHTVSACTDWIGLDWIGLDWIGGKALMG